MATMDREADDFPTLAGVRDAAAALAPHLAATPLLRSELLSRAFGGDVWLKCETMTPIASFKIRGALTALMRAREAGGVSRAVTSSTGNHGQGVAYAARLLGTPADIFLPREANPLKKAMIEAFGGTVHPEGADIDEAKDRAKAFAEEHGGLFVDDGDSRAMMEGAGTVALEIAEALDGIDALMVPIGGGNLISGSATALKELQPGARVFGVQSQGAPAMVESFHARRAVERDIDTLADGLVCRVPAPLALAAMWQRVDDAWLVTDRALLAAMHSLAESAHVLVEPAGAAALAGAWARRDEFAGKRLVLILSGANATAAQIEAALATPALVPLAHD